MSNLKDIETEIKNINTLLKNKYEEIFSMDMNQFRTEILNKAGKIKTLKKLSSDELLKFGLVVGVDGSTNRVGGAYPHYIELFQALAKPTVGERIFLNECYTPMIDGIIDNREFENKNRDKMLADIELKAALKSIEQHRPKILMMDGGLIRYKINNSDGYNELIENAEKNDVILVGVIKDLKTNIISRSVNRAENIYDREILYGRLLKGEIFEVFDAYNNKFQEGGLVSAFLRTSNSAMMVGLDLIESQREYLTDIANLVYTLTPENSRGVPLWLDIVDSEVKITDAIIKAMLEEYLDRDIYERFFISERDRRSL
ncbi:DNA double-strand break repair nuclease NurA [Peptoniphilus mikwangii]|uniref:DNA double-strand break repair nuclease NurA n=1 Tax=Peptoniphilus mikwangii TaxID=1354300 RepID=UPI00040E6B30|nr:DNA double-strand break repair nuclease NurA [Peptoniphilus mikwangii]